MPWLRVDTSKESYLLSEMPPLCGVRRPPREVNGTPTPGTIPVGNTHDHRLERQCDVPIPMEAFKTRDRRLLRRESSLEVDKQVEAQQWPECRRRTRLVASSRAATCRRPRILSRALPTGRATTPASRCRTSNHHQQVVAAPPEIRVLELPLRLRLRESESFRRRAGGREVLSRRLDTRKLCGPLSVTW